MRDRRSQRGQILIVFAGGLIALVGLAALAIDLSTVYSLQRTERSLADAAALAGAQDLTTSPTDRTIPALAYVRARQHALDTIAGALGAARPTCNTTTDPANVLDCVIGGYHVDVKADPAPSYVNVDPYRAVQVTVRNPDVPLTFARLFGQHDWNVGVTSVAGLGFGKSYTIVTLRPPASGRLPAVNDIQLSADGTQVIVKRGDVGTNANMNYNSGGVVMQLDTGYKVYFYGPATTPLWDSTVRGPAGEHVATFIQDPRYPIPPAPATTFATQSAGEIVGAPCQALAVSVLSNPKYLSTAQDLSIKAADASGVAVSPHCYNPGTYSAVFQDNNTDLTILTPGLYYFNSGITTQSMVVGGYDPAQGGVTLVVPEGNTTFKQRTGALILNAGTKFLNPGGAEPATAPVMTGGAPNTKITIEVTKDPNCQVVLPYPPLCSDSANKAISLAGGTALYLAGVQYAPTDNASAAGSSDGHGYVGQIWTWTLTYSGGTTLNQEGSAQQSAGIVHLDEACSGGTSPCTP